MERQLNWKYSAIHFTSTALTAVTIAFASVFLLDKGFLNATIGFILAISSILSIVIQTGLANYIDRNKEVTLQGVLDMISIVIIVASAILYFIPRGIFVAVLAIIIYSLVRSAVPFINSLAFIYDECNIRIKFGVARGFGSAAYALTTILMGQVLERISPSTLPIFYVCFTLMGLLAIRSYKLPESYKKIEPIIVDQFGEGIDEMVEVDIPERDKELNFSEFMIKYKRLTFLIVGVIFLLFSQTLVNYFFIQIIRPIGGDNAQMGIATFIAAGVEFPVIMNFDWLAEKRPIEFWLKLSVIFFIAKNLLTYLAVNMTMIYLAQFLQFGAFALTFPALVKYINVIVAPKYLVKGQTLLTLGTTLSSVFASLLGGILIDTVGVSHTLLIGVFTTIIGGVIIYLFVEETASKMPEPIIID